MSDITNKFVVNIGKEDLTLESMVLSLVLQICTILCMSLILDGTNDVEF